MVGVEPRVQRIQHAAGHRHAIMAFEHRGRIGEQDGYRIALADAAHCKCCTQLAAAGVKGLANRCRLLP
jgi:hypothetical protein